MSYLTVDQPIWADPADASSFLDNVDKLVAVIHFLENDGGAAKTDPSSTDINHTRKVGVWLCLTETSGEEEEEGCHGRQLHRKGKRDGGRWRQERAVRVAIRGLLAPPISFSVSIIETKRTGD
uniref:Uncharacterized protein n=1 Tax=Lactuca sativa TaxID=4236 RepID=A0A9R1XDT2_LACSA|nr:hypothetical protein LSAT_V11C500228960 [Lactuca sativa]